MTGYPSCHICNGSGVCFDNEDIATPCYACDQLDQLTNSPEGGIHTREVHSDQDRIRRAAPRRGSATLRGRAKSATRGSKGVSRPGGNV